MVSLLGFDADTEIDLYYLIQAASTQGTDDPIVALSDDKSAVLIIVRCGSLRFEFAYSIHKIAELPAGGVRLSAKQPVFGPVRPARRGRGSKGRRGQLYPQEGDTYPTLDSVAAAVKGSGRSRFVVWAERNSGNALGYGVRQDAGQASSSHTTPVSTQGRQTPRAFSLLGFASGAPQSGGACRDVLEQVRSAAGCGSDDAVIVPSDDRRSILVVARRSRDRFGYAPHICCIDEIPPAGLRLAPVRVGQTSDALSAHPTSIVTVAQALRGGIFRAWADSVAGPKARPQPAVRIGWVILPPGDAEAEAKRVLEEGGSLPEPAKERLTARRAFLEQLKPRNFICGLGEFERYFGAQFEDNLVVFDNLEYGNAAYVMYDNWEELSQRPRCELRAGGVGFDRVVHREDWEGEVRRLVQQHRGLPPGIKVGTRVVADGDIGVVVDRKHMGGDIAVTVQFGAKGKRRTFLEDAVRPTGKQPP